MNLFRGRRDARGPYPPGEPSCRKALPMAIVLTAVAMWRHRSELRELVKGE